MHILIDFVEMTKLSICLSFHIYINDIFFKHNTDKGIEKVEKELDDQSLLVMSGKLQHKWIHQISKTKKKVAPRINLTFRMIR